MRRGLNQRIPPTYDLRTLGKDADLYSRLDAFADHFGELAVLSAHESGQLSAVSRTCVGLSFLLGRLWERSGLPRILSDLLADRSFAFPGKRAVFATVLHRLCDPGSDRACEHWVRDQAIPDAEGLALHHFYRAMAWLGEPLADSEQTGATPFSPRCTKDRIEEALFARCRTLSLCFLAPRPSISRARAGRAWGSVGTARTIGCA